MGKTSKAIEYDQIDWDHLLDPKNEEDRGDLYLDDIEAISKDFVRSLRTALDQELKVIAVEGKKRADIHWASNRIAREEEDENNQWRFGTRVRITDSFNLSLEWYKNKFIPDPKGGKSRVHSKYISRGAGTKYRITSFSSAQKDELKSIEMTEQHYATLRKRANTLKELRKKLRDYEKLLETSHS